MICNLDLPAMRAVGYRQMWGHVRGEYDLARARELLIQATRQLAKRQLTWLRGWPDLQWIYTDRLWAGQRGALQSQSPHH